MEEKALLSHETLHLVEMISSERGIEMEEVFSAMEQALLRIARSNYGPELNLDARIDRKTGQSVLTRLQQVVEDVQDPTTEISLESARSQESSVDIGDYLAEELPPVPFGRMAAQTARQVIMQHVREAERTRQYEEFKERVGEIITGVVKRLEFGHAILDLGRAEATLRKDQMIPREPIRIGDRIRVLITELHPEAKGPIIVVSRTHPHFMAKLFEHKVPEVYEGLIDIKAVARDPGSRAKVAVLSHDPSIEPTGACVGLRGSRVQSVTTELQGERIDVVLWSSNIATFVVNALVPAEVLKVVVDEDMQKLRVIVADDQLSLAIGRRGQNVCLASQLVGWSVDIVTESDDASERTLEMNKRCELFQRALDIDEMLARLLYTEGFDTVEDIVLVDTEEFAAIDGLDMDVVQALKERARAYLEKEKRDFELRCRDQGVEKQMLDLEGLGPSDLEGLIQANIKTRDDLGELSGFELLSILGKGQCTLDRANRIILSARSHWF